MKPVKILNDDEEINSRTKFHFKLIFLLCIISLFSVYILYLFFSKKKNNIIILNNSELIKKLLIKSAVDVKEKFNLYRAGKLLGDIPINPKPPLISVILPAYNVEDYIVSAIRSIQSQTFKEIEIIIVDDKSTDNTLEKVLKIQEEDKRIKIFENKQNKGTFFSRSFGAYQSKGNYITFLDPDDIFFNQKILEISYKNIISGNYDIVEFQILMGSENIIPVTDDVITKNGTIFLYPELVQRMYEINGRIGYNSGSIVGKLIKRESLIKALEFFKSKNFLEENICNGEDQLSLFYIYHSAKSLIVIRDYGMYYYSRKDSATHKYDDISQKKMLISHLKIMNFFFENPYMGSENSVKKYYKFLFEFLILPLKKHIKDKNEENLVRFLNNIKKCEFCDKKYVFKSLNITNNLK